MPDQTSASMTASANDSPQAARPGERDGRKHLRLDGERTRHDGRRDEQPVLGAARSARPSAHAPTRASAAEASTAKTNSVGDRRRDDPEARSLPP